MSKPDSTSKPPERSTPPAHPKPEAKPADAPLHEGVNRNDPCWCGSGSKYKKCHWSEDRRG